MTVLFVVHVVYMNNCFSVLADIITIYGAFKRTDSDSIDDKVGYTEKVLQFLRGIPSNRNLFWKFPIKRKSQKFEVSY